MTIFKRLADYHLGKLSTLRPINADPGSYLVPTAFLELAHNLFVGASDIKLPVHCKEIVEKYIVIDTAQLISLDSCSAYSYDGGVDETQKGSLERLERLHNSKSNAFIQERFADLLKSGAIYMAIDAEEWNEAGDPIVPFIVDLNLKGFELQHGTLDIDHKATLTRLKGADFKRMSHASPMVISATKVCELLAERYSFAWVESDSFVPLEKVIRAVYRDSQRDSAEYRDGCKAIREFDIQAPIFSFEDPKDGSAADMILSGSCAGKVYLNRAGKFATVTINCNDPATRIGLNPNTLLDACVSVTEISHDGDISVRTLSKENVNASAVFDGCRVITATFAIDGWS